LLAEALTIYYRTHQRIRYKVRQWKYSEVSLDPLGMRLRWRGVLFRPASSSLWAVIPSKGSAAAGASRGGPRGELEVGSFPSGGRPGRARQAAYPAGHEEEVGSWRPNAGRTAQPDKAPGARGGLGERGAARWPRRIEGRLPGYPHRRPLTRRVAPEGLALLVGLIRPTNLVADVYKPANPRGVSSANTISFSF
jgi:hypothetical protein